MPTPNPSTSFGAYNILTAVTAVSSTDVWAVGWSLDPNLNTILTVFEHWNGSRWTMADSPTPSGAFQFLNGVAAVSTNDVWAVGSDQSGSPSASLAAHWNGSKWRIVPTPPGTGGERALHSVTASGPNDVWAVGDDLPGGSVTAAVGLTEHWDGSAWTAIPSAGSPRSGGDRLFGVAMLGPNDVWAVGEATNARSGRQFTLTEHWNGSAWTVAASPNIAVQNTLLGVAALAPGTLWAVGAHEAATGCCLRTLTLETTNG